MKKFASNYVRFNHPEANMYGCFPCPKCKGRFRAAYKRKDTEGVERLRIECDDCGHRE